MFNAILLNKNDDGSTKAEITQIDDAQLPEDGDVTVAVDYSTINYKDGLAITGKSPVVRKWPMVPGIDGGFVVLGKSTSRMTKSEMSDLQTLMEAFGAEKGVRFAAHVDPETGEVFA